MSSISKTPVVVLLSAMTLALPGCGNPSSETAASNVIKYSIEDSNVTPGIKRALDVRLYQKASEEELRNLAHTLRGLDSARYQRTFIHYYLPGMVVGEGAWARTDFNPELEVQIFGLSIEHDAAIDREDSKIPGEILGRWSDEKIGMPGCYTLFRDNGKTYIKTTFKDAGSTTFEVVEKPTTTGKRYEEVEPEHGEYFLVDSSGTLKRGDSRGIWASMQAVERPLNRKSGAVTSVEQPGTDSANRTQPNEVVTAKEILVSITLEPKVQTDRRVIVVGKTSLPADTELFIGVSDAIWAEFLGSVTAKVSADGSFESETLRPLENGLYVAKASLAFKQPKHVEALIGTKGEYLKGPHVKIPPNKMFGDIMRVEVEALAKFQVGGEDAVTQQVARLTKKLDQYKEFPPLIEDLYNRLETIKTKKLVPNSNYLSMRPGSTANVFWADLHRLIDQVNASISGTRAGNCAQNSLADIMTMWMNIEDESEYQSAKADYVRDFKELKDFIRESDEKLAASSVSQESQPTVTASTSLIASKPADPIDINEQSFRTWTSTSGKFSTEAKLISYANGLVTLESRTGKQIKVGVEKLSEADKEFVEKWRSQSR